MELLNIQFAILLGKLVICVLPVVLGVALISTKEEGKCEMRKWGRIRLFGFGNAIDHFSFARTVLILGIASVAFGAVATWFLFLAGLVQEPVQ